ncbi:hypothetical protein HZ996_03055 [Cryomorphaceae bacterium]|nr:hypothetical protein HZ996_03055 [Cryomorphaceae bacterium]
MRLFEFEDLPGFPSSFRRWQMDYIRFAVDLLNPYGSIEAPWKDQKAPKTWVDLATGTGGPVPQFLRRWLKTSETCHLIRTDRFPSEEGVEYLDLRSDAFPPAEFYTLFNAFHHFAPADQKDIMAKMSTGTYALIAEPLSRSVFTFVGIFLLTGLLHWIFAPFVRPWSWRRMLWTYPIPVMPIVTCWDGLVSVLRAPRQKELETLARQASTSRFHWSVESVSFPFGSVLILIGQSIDKA